MLAFVQDLSELGKTIANYGALGICFVALAVWHVRTVRRAERREEQFQSEYAAIVEKYRSTLEKFSGTLDVLVQLIRGRSP